MTVPGIGPKDARIILVGEAPGAEEELRGEPFVGSSGKLLNDCLANVGISRSECYLTNVMKTRPPGNNFGVFYNDKSRRDPSDLLRKSTEDLHKELRNISANVIVALGGEPLKALVAKSGIDKWRGSILSSPVGKVVPTYHPAYILRMYHHRSILELDLKRALEESTTPGLSLPQHSLMLRPTYAQVMEHLRYLQSSKPPIAFDIETSGQHTRCLGLAWSPRDAICIPFIAKPEAPISQKLTLGLEPVSSEHDAYWTEDQERQVLVLLAQIFHDPEIPKIAQNFPFDSTILARDFGIWIRGLECDTLLLHHCCYSELPKSLDFLCSVYTRVPRYSDYDPSSDLSTWRYNAMDCCVTHEAWTAIKKEAFELDVWNFYKEIVEPCMIALTRAQNRGVKLHLGKRTLLQNETEEKIQVLEKEIYQAVEGGLNPQSPKQMKDYFYGKLRLATVISRHTGKPTLNEDALIKLSHRYPKYGGIINLCLEHRQKRVLLSTFLQSRLGRHSRAVTSYNVAGTVNGRLSSSQTIFGEGGNLQNIPKSDLRRIFLPERDAVFIKCDLSQAEVRVVAWIAGIKTLIERFTLEPDFDIHKWNATNIYPVGYEDVTGDQRSVAKAGVHGGNYGLGAQKAASLFGISFQDAKRAIEAYRSNLPEVKVWWEQVQAEVSKTRSLTSPLGRKRHFFGRLDQDLFRSAYSFVPQATVADIINRAFAEAEPAGHRHPQIPGRL